MKGAGELEGPFLLLEGLTHSPSYSNLCIPYLPEAF